MTPPSGDAGLGVKVTDSFVPPSREECTVLRTAGQGPRIEPKLNDPPAAKPTYEELRALAALYDTPPPRRRTMARTGIIALIFVVGAAAGFGITALLGGEQGASRSSFPGMHAYQGTTSAGELPYDGRATAAAKWPSPEASRGISTEELPYGGKPSSGASMDKPEAIESPALPLQPSPPPGTELASETPGKAESPPLPSPSAEKPAKRRDALRSQAKAAPTPQHRHRPQRRNEKDREIQRIRQQAEDELKKKTDRRTDPPYSASRGAGQKESRTEAVTHGTRTAAVTAMLQQCELADNIFRREYCKWQICSGKWGKNGCPSYPPRSSAY